MISSYTGQVGKPLDRLHEGGFLMHLVALCSLLVLSAAEPKLGTYTDQKHEYRIGIPQGWSLMATTDKTRVLSMTAPDFKHSDANVSLRVLPPLKAVLEGKMTLDDVINSARKSIQRRYPDYRITKQERVTLNGRKVLKIWSQMTLGRKTLKGFQFMLVDSDHNYVLTWTCRSESFVRYEAQFLAATNAFRLLKPAKEVDKVD
jgi:hypothetical protein